MILSYITLKCTTVFWRGIYCKGLIIVKDTGVLCCSLLEQVFYFLLLVTNRNGNRPTESMKSHAFCGVAGSSGSCVVWVYEI